MAAVAAQLRYSPLSSSNKHNTLFANHRCFSVQSDRCSSIYFPSSSSSSSQLSSSSLNLTRSFKLQTRAKHPDLEDVKVLNLPDDVVVEDNETGGYGSSSGAGGDNGHGGCGGGSGGGGSGGNNRDGESRDGSELGLIGLFLQGWRSRVTADPQFPFKVLMEELVGVSACVLGDMASRPNFGLNELDFVFSTLVVGSILNFVLMYLLAPTSATMSVSSSSSNILSAIFANCPKSHMFESGTYGVLERFGTFVYKGTVFAAVGFGAGLVGTAISNGLIAMRKKMDPNFETQNKPPPTLLNALTWAGHMGLSSNLRYQTLNGLEFLLEKGLPPLMFKSSIVILRCLNNVLGGVSFVVLARLTGAQKVDESKADASTESGKEEAAAGGGRTTTINSEQ